MATQVASLYGTLDLVDNFTPGLNVALGGVDNFTGRLGSAGGHLMTFGAVLGQAVAPAMEFAKAGVGAASDFDSAMAEISARTGIVGDDLERVSDFALQMGADTSFSAQQAADGFLQLLSSGQNTEQALATLPIVLDAAAASGESLGKTADTLTDIMAAYKLEVKDAAMVSDALARAAGASSADIASLGQGFANVGGVANAFNLSVNDTAAVLAIFSENGIKGAEAGTQLKSMLLNMSRDTEKVQGAWKELGFSMYDAMGNARPLNDVMRDLNWAMASMTPQQQNELITTLAGSYGQLGLRALLAENGIEGMTTLMAEQAGASEVAAARMDTFKGTVDSLQGSMETLQIKAFTPFMNEVLKPMAQDLTQMVNLVADWAGENPKLTMSVIGLVFGLAALATASTFGGMALTALGAAVAVIFSPLGLLIGLVALAGLAFSTNFLGIRDAVQPVLDVLGLATKGFAKTFELLLTGSNAFDALRNGLGFFVDDMARALGLTEKQARGIQHAFMDVTRFIQAGDWSGLGNMLTDGLGKAVPAFNDFWGKLRESSPAAMEALGGVMADVADWLGEKIVDLGGVIAQNAPKIIGGLLIMSAMISQWIIGTAIPELAGLAWDMASNFAMGFVNGITNNGADLGGFTGAIMNVISALPVLAAVAVTDFGPQLLAAMTGSLGDMGVWSLGNIIGPVTGALLNPANWAMATTVGMVVLTQMGTTAINGLEWAAIHIIVPIVGALLNPTNWALAAATLGVIAFQMALSAFDGILWATTNIITPLVLALTNPESWAWLAGTIGIITAAMALTVMDGALWATSNIISPIVLALTNAENWAWASGVLASIFSVLGSGTANATSFVNDKIVNPIKTALTAAYNSIAQAINDLFPDTLSLDFGSIDIDVDLGWPLPRVQRSVDFGSYSMSLGNPVAMRAMGGPVTGGNPYIVGEKGPELMVPRSSGEIIPNHELGSGGRGGITIHGDVAIYGVNDIESMYDQLQMVQQHRGA